MVRNHQKYDPSAYGEDTVINDLFEHWLPFDPKRGLNTVLMQQNKIVSEEETSGLNLRAPVENEFVDFTIEHTNLATRFGA